MKLHEIRGAIEKHDKCSGLWDLDAPWTDMLDYEDWQRIARALLPVAEAAEALTKTSDFYASFYECHGFSVDDAPDVICGTCGGANGYHEDHCFVGKLEAVLKEIQS